VNGYSNSEGRRTSRSGAYVTGLLAGKTVGYTPAPWGSEVVHSRRFTRVTRFNGVLLQLPSLVGGIGETGRVTIANGTASCLPRAGLPMLLRRRAQP